MIVVESVEISGDDYIHTYSNSKLYIRKSNSDEYYTDAYDVSENSYVETTIPIPATEEDKADAIIALQKATTIKELRTAMLNYIDVVGIG